MSSELSRRGAERAKAVLDATVGLLTEVGFAGLTIDAVAARAHSSKATIYKSWPTKTDLVVAIAQQIESPPMPTLVADATLTESLRNMVDAVRELTVGASGHLILALHAASRMDPIINTAVELHLVEPHQRAIAGALNEMKAATLLADHVDTDLAGRVVAGLIVDRALASGLPIPVDELDRIVTSWLVPVFGPQVVGSRTPGPPAGPG
jgi:AcrR family transcriptional regulator